MLHALSDSASARKVIRSQQLPKSSQFIESESIEDKQYGIQLKRLNDVMQLWEKWDLASA